MGLVILQEKSCPTGRSQGTARNEIRVSLARQTAHQNCRARATLRVTFGADVKHAEYYCVGVDDGRLVLVPTDDCASGYKVTGYKDCKNKALRIDLTDTVLSLFSSGVIDALKTRRRYSLSGSIDKDLYVWIDGYKQ